MKKFISDKILCVWRAMVWCAVATAVHSCADEPILPAGADVIPEFFAHYRGPDRRRRQEPVERHGI